MRAAMSSREFRFPVSLKGFPEFSLLNRDEVQETSSLPTPPTAIQSAVAETIVRPESESAGIGPNRRVWGRSGFGSPPETGLLRGRWGALRRKFSTASFGGGLSGFYGDAACGASPQP